LNRTQLLYRKIYDHHIGANSLTSWRENGNGNCY
jgi:hypothetical protein